MERVFYIVVTITLFEIIRLKRRVWSLRPLDRQICSFLKCSTLVVGEFFLSLKKLNIKKLHPGFFAIWQIKMHLKVKMKWQLGKVFQSILAYLECRFSGIWKEGLRLWYQKTYFVSKEPIDKHIIVQSIHLWCTCCEIE